MPKTVDIGEAIRADMPDGINRIAADAAGLSRTAVTHDITPIIIRGPIAIPPTSIEHIRDITPRTRLDITRGLIRIAHTGRTGAILEAAWA
jgi:hypothetical protein